MMRPEPPFSPQVCHTMERLENGMSLVRLRLLPGPVAVESWQMLHHCMQHLPTELPVLLESACSTVPMLSPPEEQAWIVAAGAYRRAQETFKAQGGTLLSLVTECLVGGTYLIHGFAAQHRLIDEEAKVYPTLHPDRYEAIFRQTYPFSASPAHAHQAGLVTVLTGAKRLKDDLRRYLRAIEK